MPSFSAQPGGRHRPSLQSSFVPDTLALARASDREVFVPDDSREQAGEEAGRSVGPSLEEQIERARAEGHAAGRSELPWHEAESLREVIRALEEAARGVGELRLRYLREQRHALVELALAIAEKLVRRQVEADPDALAEVVKACLAAVQTDESEAADPVAVLRLAPAQIELLERGLAPEMTRISREAGLDIEADPTLEGGDVRILSARWRVDARLQELLEQMREALAEVLDVEEERP